MTRLAELRVAAEADAWRAAGVPIDGDGAGWLGGVRLRVDPTLGTPGLRSWVLRAAPATAPDDVDGLPTEYDDEGDGEGARGSAGGGEAPAVAGRAPSDGLGITGIDHVVVLTPDLDRTVGVIEGGLGLPLLRIRESDGDGAPMRQAFFRLGPVILEVVGGAEPDPRGGAARFLGVALTVADLEGAAERLGPLVGRIKPAVQRGRRIATVRREAHLGAAVALMSPEPDTS